jgi:hypothetical protein
VAICIQIVNHSTRASIATTPLCLSLFMNFSIGVVDNAIQYGICDGRFRELPIPTQRLKLRAKDDGASLVPGVDQFQQISGLGFRQGDQHPFVEDEQLNLFQRAMAFLKRPSPRAMFNSSRSSGSLAQRTVKPCLQASMPKAQARYVFPLPVAPRMMILCCSRM